MSANRHSNKIIRRWAAVLAVGGALLACSSGCSSSPAGDQGSGGAGGTNTAGSGGATAGSGGAAPDGGPDAAAPTFATVAALVALDPMKGALSEGMAIREQKAYLGYASTGEI